MCCPARLSSVFFFTDPATTEIYTLSLHDALPISGAAVGPMPRRARLLAMIMAGGRGERLQPLTRERSKSAVPFGGRSEEHTSELQSHHDLVCRLLLEKKKKKKQKNKNIKSKKHQQ